MGQSITGKMLIELAETYTESLNKGGIPIIESAWNYIQSNEIETAYKQSLKVLNDLVTNDVYPTLPMIDDKINHQFKSIKQQSV